MSDQFVSTRGERLLVRRKRDGLTQPQAAEKYGVSPDKYRDWESDRRCHDQPNIQVGIIRPNEMCMLLRRRSGKLQKEIAEEIECSRLWVIQMEEGTAPINRLREYWGI